MSSPYDVLIVGAGVVGCALAHALSRPSSARDKPLRIALLERSLAEPDRIVGELLQPGGVAALRELGMADCLEGIDAVPVHGYCVVHDGKTVHIPYPDDAEGRSFHHGGFIMKLREKARAAPGVEVIEATVSDLIECQFTGRVLGVKATRKVAGTGAEKTYAGTDAEKETSAGTDGGKETSAGTDAGKETSAGTDAGKETSAGTDAEKEAFFADLVVIADGCFSNFRSAVMGKAAIKPQTKSHFVGVVLEDARLPIPQHGTVCLVKGQGPVLLYQIGEHDTRMLVDVKQPLPADLKSHILTKIVPELPAALHLPIQAALDKDRLRRMPNSFLPPTEQGVHTREGAILLGDAWNMRHPLTGGGMTVAFHDVVLLSALLADVPDLADWARVSRELHRWHWARKRLASTVNILSVALYDLFGADDECLEVLRTGCFKYFERGGDCVRGPVLLLSAIAPDPVVLFKHFFAVAFYSLWVMFTHPRPVYAPGADKPTYVAPRLDQYPLLVIKAFRVFWTACVVFGPLMWTEIRWT